MSPYDPGVSHTFEAPTWGEVAPDALARIVVVSPHFDDAAMGAGHLLGTYEDTTVITVLAGRPPEYPAEPTEWTRSAASWPATTSSPCVAKRTSPPWRCSNQATSWLEFSDHQYLEPKERPTPDEVAPVLAETIAGLDPTAVFFPMGLANPDHVMVHDACLQVLAATRACGGSATRTTGTSICPACWRGASAKLLRSQPWPTPAIVPHVPDEERKRRAIWCYTSQIPPLERDHALSTRMEGRVPEQFWRLAPPPRGWEGLADLV